MNNLNIVIPMSGRGSRFAQAGYTFPKPLIDIQNEPMIKVVIDNLNLKGRYIFLVLREHYEKYALKYLLPLITKPNPCEIIIVDEVTEGAACTVLLARDFIDNNLPLIIANSDQWIDWNQEHFLNFVKSKNADGCILTFTSSHPKWSFVKLNEDTNLITEVAEKKPISQVATVGIYYFNHGANFVNAANEMIKRNIRTNNEFYVAPVYNILIEQKKKIYPYPVAEMKSLGTPEDLQKYLINKG